MVVLVTGKTLEDLQLPRDAQRRCNRAGSVTTLSSALHKVTWLLPTVLKCAREHTFEILGECVSVYVRGGECSGPVGLGGVWGAGEGWWRPAWIERRQSELACPGLFPSQESVRNLLTHTGPSAKIFLCASMSQDFQKPVFVGEKGSVPCKAHGDPRLVHLG